MARPKRNVEEAEEIVEGGVVESVEEVVEAPTEKASRSEKGEATVVWRGNSRTYTSSIHGKDYKALAVEFAKKIGGKVI